MSQQKQKRSRGLIFTDEGLQKLQSTIPLGESRDQLRKKHTYEEFSEITGLAYNTVFKVLKRNKGVDKRTLVQFFMAFDLELTRNDYTLLDSPSKYRNKCTIKWINWDDTIDVSNFYGRTAELATLKKWLVEDRCRLVTIYGMGGIGKTTLSVSLVEQIKNRFEYVLFISFKKPPLLKKVLTDITQFLSNKQMSETKFSNCIKGSFSELFNYLRSHRCLIVLDEVETVMQAGVYSGHYQEKYKNYSQLIRYMGEVSHQSCFLLITREPPKEAAICAGKTMPIRLMRLNGLQPLEGHKILQEQFLFGTVSEQNTLIESYSGNPL
ncbi:MAG: NB-ARC domain-containing protein, partial [Cyanobacteriota bacterium]|nr:NB-ARC domain-containing protein [Cyanobacteriota bacterium]